MRLRRGAHVVLAIWAALGCGSPAAAPIARSLPDPTLPPSTDRDPPPFTPAPAADAHTGEAVAVATSGGDDQARALAIHFVRALRDGDEAALTRILAEHVGRVRPRLSSPNRNRADLINAFIHSPRRNGLGPDVPLEQILDANRMQVRPLARLGDGQAIPPGLSGADLLVTFPLQVMGRQYLRFLVGWPREGALVVRPGIEAQVVAL